jgi:hypothetical protein
MSPTFGSFHRCYWLHKLSDFPSAARQQGVLVLAQLWREGESLEISRPALMELIEGSLDYTCSLQNKDGSFDEWYPNERGWAGPTGYIIHALSSVFEVCGPQLSLSCRERLINCLKEGADFLSHGWERHVLFNHVAMALLPVYQVHLIREDDHLEDSFKKLFEKFKSYFNYSEGWGLEYDGADIGYQSATISFLSRLHERAVDPSLKEEVRIICESSLTFIEHFCFPDGRFSAKVGSRETDVLFPYGVEYWANQGSEKAQAIALFARDGFQRDLLLTPKDHEDHYLLYRLPEFMETSFIYKRAVVCTYRLPFERDFYERDFSGAKIFCLKKNGFFCIVNFSRGGMTLRYDCALKKAVTIDRGILVTDENQRVYTSSQVGKTKVERVGEYSFTVKGKFTQFSPKVFTSSTFLIFRLSCALFAWNKMGAYWLKAFVRFLLLRLGSSSSYDFERRINLLAQEVIADSFPDLDGQAHLTGEFDIRFVPQSRYFHRDDFNFRPKSDH